MLGHAEDPGLLAFVFVPHVEWCLLMDSRETGWGRGECACLTPSSLSSSWEIEGAKGARRPGRGPPEAGHAPGERPGVSVDVRDLTVALEKGARWWGTGTALPPPPVLPCPHKMQPLDGSCAPGPSAASLPSQRLSASHPFRPRAATHRDPPGARAFSKL